MKSFIEVSPDSDFPIQNLPYGVFSKPGDETRRIGVAIGDQVLDLSAIRHLFTGPILSSQQDVFAKPSLNALMALGRPAWTEARETIQKLLSADEPTLRDNQELRAAALVPQADVTMHLPAEVGDYTDFYSSREHASNLGSMFRDPSNPLLPNWLHIPVGYHGRASSVVISGTPLHRPCGQTRPNNGPVLACCHNRCALTGSVECGQGNVLQGMLVWLAMTSHVALESGRLSTTLCREKVPPSHGALHGVYCHSHRHPALSTLDAVVPPSVVVVASEPAPLPYLKHDDPYSFDIKLSVKIVPEGGSGKVVANTNFKHMYWTMKQQLAHHTITGCNVRPGDLMGSGTISGTDPSAYGSMIELSWKGTKELDVGDGEKRKFLKDGDTVVLAGHCQGDGYRVGFGQCSGKVLPARVRVD
ncbi:fumarylacetoacetase [Salpingoeca rosetta]|uniref:Fumarylacetoacetase n=1 Tax=Salpingoeca rosetta (strain ATCC 50818 / BSB-021) TaxID=946362 RepID=F2U102_SALR5|nr:fumarylacetoacetase [Salpingoeca rosetta]EGD80576.1 fumarylacetoacetase [Salpingoeca rosetta]|eukprot:XP_004997137.1 fumarylacetoacetase [Salpingoeca rosetta]